VGEDRVRHLATVAMDEQSRRLEYCGYV
jgi:hypothetical protein